MFSSGVRLRPGGKHPKETLKRNNQKVTWHIRLAIQTRWKSQDVVCYASWEEGGRSKFGFEDKGSWKLVPNKIAHLWILRHHFPYSIILFSFPLYFSNLCALLASGLFSTAVSFSRFSKLERQILWHPSNDDPSFLRRICYSESSFQKWPPSSLSTL